MAQPTYGEMMHMKVMEYMQIHLLRRADMQGITAKTINDIAKEAAGIAKRHLENQKT